MTEEGSGLRDLRTMAIIKTAAVKMFYAELAYRWEVLILLSPFVTWGN